MTPPSRDSPDYADEVNMNTLIVSWIFAMLDASLFLYVPYKDNAKALWDMLKQQFFTSNGPRMYELEGALMNCKKHGLSVLEYFGKRTKIWEELANYEKAPDCYCGVLTCKLIINTEK